MFDFFLLLTVCVDRNIKIKLGNKRQRKNIKTILSRKLIIITRRQSRVKYIVIIEVVRSRTDCSACGVEKREQIVLYFYLTHFHSSFVLLVFRVQSSVIIWMFLHYKSYFLPHCRVTYTQCILREGEEGKVCLSLIFWWYKGNKLRKWRKFHSEITALASTHT